MISTELFHVYLGIAGILLVAVIGGWMIGVSRSPKSAKVALKGDGAHKR